MTSGLETRRALEAMLFLADEPLVYAHQQQYLRSALEILENGRPWHFVLTSDEWRRWLGTWTIAPH